MLLLAIDTSCDDTSAALLEYDNGGGYKLATSVVSGQEDIHSLYGGVVPELASRRHIENIQPVVDRALQGRADELTAVAVCAGPGLIGSLLVGCSFAKAFSFARGGLPLVAVNHLEGHLYSVFLEDKRPQFPFLSLIVSGGHTSLYKVVDFCNCIELGRTRDDAAGEAYDKVAKLLGIAYPGGPEIDRMAREGNPKAVEFPRAYIPGGLDFSFSGLKTAVLNFKNNGGLDKHSIEDISASFQAAVVDVLVRKTEWAVRDTEIKRVAVSGRVAANSGLRASLEHMAVKRKLDALYLPERKFCTDNAAMIALAGLHRLRAGERAGLDLNPRAWMPL